MLRRQRVQMFRGFSARLMEAVHRLGIDGLNLPTIPEDDGRSSTSSASWLKSWRMLRPKSRSSSMPSAGSSWDLQGRGSSPTFSAFAPTLTWRMSCRGRAPAPPGTPDRATQARAARLDITLQCLHAIYAHPGTSAAAGQESSYSDDTTSFGESGSEEAEEAGGDGVMESSREASSESSQGTGDDEGSEEDAP
jgi:hypothetical protein